ncbi:DNA-binding transcriptional LysR family regulator [Sphingomonas sp. UYAg733]
MMDRLDAMSLLIAAVDEGSLAAAARRHGRSAAAATRAVTMLEEIGGEKLLLRSTRRLSLTTAGERKVAIWREILAKLTESELAAVPGQIAGTIVITAPELFGRLKFMPVVESFLADHPQVSARVLMLNRMVDLVGEGIDLAVRLAPLGDSNLTAVRLGEVHRFVCAAPDYVARCGLPEHPRDLEHHDCIGLNGEGDGELWSFIQPNRDGSRVRAVRVEARLSLNCAGAAIDAALRGHGVIRPLSYQVAEHLADGRLIRLLPKFEPPAFPVHLVFHPEPAKRGALRAFIDHATPLLRSELAEATELGNATPRQPV